MSKIVFHVDTAAAKTAVKALSGTFKALNTDIKGAVGSVSKLDAAVTKLGAKGQQLQGTTAQFDRLAHSTAAAASGTRSVTTAVNQMTNATNRANRSLGGPIGGLGKSFSHSIVSRIAGMTGAFVSIQQAISIIRNDMMAIVETYDRVAASRITEEQAFANLTLMVAGEGPETTKRVQQGAHKLVSETGISLPNITNLFAGAFSTLTGEGGDIDKNLDKTFAFIRTLAPVLAPFQGTQQADLLKAIGAVSETDPAIRKLPVGQQALAGAGMIQAVATTALPDDFRQVATTFAGALSDVLANGGDFRLANQLYSGISTGGQDPQGRRTATAVSAIADYAPAFFRDDPRLAGAGLNAQVAELRANPELAEEFFGYKGFASFEKRIKSGIRSVLFPDKATSARGAAAFDLAGALGLTPQGFVERGQTTLQGMTDMPGAAAGQRQRNILAFGEKFRREQSVDPLTTAEKTVLEDVYTRSGQLANGGVVRGLRRKGREIAEWWEPLDREQAIDVMLGQQRAVRARQINLDDAGAPADPELARMIESIDTLIQELRQGNTVKPRQE